MSGAGVRWAVRGMLLFALIGLVMVTAKGAGLRWDPFGLDQRRAAAREAALDQATADSHARRLEASGERGQAQRRLDAQSRRSAAFDVVAQLDHYLEEVPNAPLDQARLDRLRDVDERLCRLAPELDGCPASP